jgi:phosphoribosyl 1,2-cyclic phosphate phosphodiesterase
MPTSLKVTILGCGGSTGVPMVGNLWGRCDPNNPRNIRTRPSILLQTQGKTILVDTSPDVRQQLLRHKIDRLDAILYTHYHADHTHGLNDVMLYSRRQKHLIPIYGTDETIQNLKHVFSYAFPGPKDNQTIYQPFLEAHTIKPGQLDILGVTIRAFEQDHVSTISMGYRIQDFAYTTDAKNLDTKAFKALEGVQTWIVDGLRHMPHATHSHIQQSLEWIKHVQPKRAILSHLSCWTDYDELSAELPNGIEVAYDGLEINIPS